MKFFNKLFKQQPKQPEYKWEPWEVKAARYDVMDNRNMADLASQGIKNREFDELYSKAERYDLLIK